MNILEQERALRRHREDQEGLEFTTRILEARGYRINNITPRITELCVCVKWWADQGVKSCNDRSNDLQTTEEWMADLRIISIRTEDCLNKLIQEREVVRISQ